MASKKPKLKPRPPKTVDKPPLRPRLSKKKPTERPCVKRLLPEGADIRAIDGSPLEFLVGHWYHLMLDENHPLRVQNTSAIERMHKENVNRAKANAAPLWEIDGWEPPETPTRPEGWPKITMRESEENPLSFYGMGHVYWFWPGRTESIFHVEDRENVIAWAEAKNKRNAGLFEILKGPEDEPAPKPVAPPEPKPLAASDNLMAPEIPGIDEAAAKATADLNAKLPPSRKGRAKLNLGG